MITEHGLSTPDDSRRVAYLETSLLGLLDAVDEGVPVLGYVHWTLVDSFEWIFGYGPPLGLHDVDRATFARTPKPSAHPYPAIARVGGVAATRDHHRR